MPRIARMLLTPEFCREIMHLPIETEILGSGAYHGKVEVFLTHPDLADVPLREGDCPPLVRPTVRRQEPVVFVDWGQD
jgi:hypothetical protein